MERNEQKLNDTWDLSSLVKDDESFIRDLKKVEKRIKEVRAIKGLLAHSFGRLAVALHSFVYCIF